MKKTFKFLSGITLCSLLFSVTACSKKNQQNQASVSSTSKTITVGASPVPHAEILKQIQGDLKAEGYDLVIKEFTDYVTPNDALESGELDANFFQHIPYMNEFNTQKGYHMVNALGVHIEPMAIFSKKIKNLNNLTSGMTIAIPNDPTNEGRALLLLESANIIKLKDSSNLLSTPQDISSNPKNLKFREIEAASLPRMLDDVDCAVINGNYAIPAGFNINSDALLVESASSPYVNVIAVKSGRENSPEIQALVKALKNGKVKKYIQDTYKNGEVVCVL